MVMEIIHGLMELRMKENGKRTNLVDKVYILGLMVELMMDNLKKV